MKPIKLPIPAIEFYPPMQGLDGRFNTFRLGLAWSKRVSKGDYVLLLDNKTKVAFARARVTGVHTGTLCEMAKLYAHLNHNQRHDPSNARQNIVTALMKRYGPQMVTVDKKVTVIDLRRLK
jgi:hypothetical protein